MKVMIKHAMLGCTVFRQAQISMSFPTDCLRAYLIQDGYAHTFVLTCMWFTLGWTWAIKSSIGAKIFGRCSIADPTHTELLCLLGFTWVGKCPFLGILNITFKYLLDIISPKLADI